MSQVVKVWYLLESALARLLLGLIGVLPLPVVLALACGAARLVFLLWRSRRRVAIENLLRAGLCQDERDAKRLGLASFRTFCVMVAETVVARRRLTRANWKEHVRLCLSPEAEESIRKSGQGIIVASAHLGNWEVAARAVSMLKPICVVYRPFKNPYLNRAMHAARSGEQLHLVSRLDREPMRFVRALSAGEIVALMIDQHAAEGRVAVEFFGRRAWTTKSVAMMHLLSRAPLLVACAIRTGPLQYDVHAVGPVRCERTGDREADATAITQALTREIEQLIRRYPEQYMWGHRRWKE